MSQTRSSFVVGGLSATECMMYNRVWYRANVAISLVELVNIWFVFDIKISFTAASDFSRCRPPTSLASSGAMAYRCWMVDTASPITLHTPGAELVIEPLAKQYYERRMKQWGERENPPASWKILEPKTLSSSACRKAEGVSKQRGVS